MSTEAWIRLIGMALKWAGQAMDELTQALTDAPPEAITPEVLASIARIRGDLSRLDEHEQAMLDAAVPPSE